MNHRQATQHGRAIMVNYSALEQADLRPLGVDELERPATKRRGRDYIEGATALLADDRAAIAPATRMPGRSGGHDGGKPSAARMPRHDLPSATELPLRLGTLILWRPRLRMPSVDYDDALFRGDLGTPALPDDEAWIWSVPDVGGTTPTLRWRDGKIDYVHYRYVRCWVDMRGEFRTYHDACLPAKLRSDIRRQTKRILTETGEKSLDIRYYRTLDEIREFYALARSISARTFQERKLGCGLPSSEAFKEDLYNKARAGSCFGTILFIGEKAVSFQYMVNKEKRLIGKYIGFDPVYQNFSPGKVHMFSCIEHLFGDHTFEFYDFAGGDFQYMVHFSSHSAPCADMLRLRPHPGNVMLIGAHACLASLAKACANLRDKLGLHDYMRRKLRGR